MARPRRSSLCEPGCVGSAGAVRSAPGRTPWRRRDLLRWAAASTPAAIGALLLPGCGPRQDPAFNSPPLYPVRRAGRWGFVDPDGVLVVPPRYDWASRFWGDLAVVERDGRAGYLGLDGNEAISPRFRLDDAEDTAARTFGDGLAAVRVDQAWGYINPAGAFIIAPRFADCGDFGSGLAYASEDGARYGLIDLRGTWVLEPRYPAMNDYAGGLAAHVRGGRWGFVDRSGRERIKPAYDGAGAFTGPLAPVQVEGQWGFVDRSGQTLVKPSYRQAGGFVNSHAPVCDAAGRWGYLKLPSGGGPPVLGVPHRYDAAGPYLGPVDAKDGRLLAQVEQAGEVFYIDTVGHRHLG